MFLGCIYILLLNLPWSVLQLSYFISKDITSDEFLIQWIPFTRSEILCNNVLQQSSRLDHERKADFYKNNLTLGYFLPILSNHYSFLTNHILSLVFHDNFLYVKFLDKILHFSFHGAYMIEIPYMEGNRCLLHDMGAHFHNYIDPFTSKPDIVIVPW